MNIPPSVISTEGGYFYPKSVQPVIGRKKRRERQKIARTLADIEKNTTFAVAIGLWCNGNTTDSGPVIHGSSPCNPTEKAVRRAAFFCLPSTVYSQLVISKE